MVFADLKQFHEVITKTSYEEFKFAIQSGLGRAVNDDYVRSRWALFESDPVAFMVSRNPIEQGEHIFRIAMGKLRRGTTTGR